MKWKPFSLLLIFTMTIQSSLVAQKWRQMMRDPNASFYDVQAEFNKYWSQYPDLEEKLKKGEPEEKEDKEAEQELPLGYLQFKRWEQFMEPRVYPTGFLPNASQTLWHLSNTPPQQQQQPQSQGIAVNGNWYFVGPSTIPTNGGGMGRLNCVRVNPTNNNIIWAGAPAGGLWKSTDGGSTWTTNTDNLSNLGISEIAIDPNNDNIMYIGTGDFDGGVTYSYGLLKSTDGGNTWATTGLSLSTNQISRILINPSNSAIIYVATWSGIYKSTNSGSTFTNVFSGGSISDMEFMPGTPTTIYAAGGSTGETLYKSTNSGSSWTNTSTGLPAAGNLLRMAIGVTAANPNVVYVLGASSNGSGFYGLYKSTNAGASFTTQSTSPNILGWYLGTGSDTTGQGGYTLSLAISPTNENTVYTGGVNIWKSTDAGVNWTLTGHWYGGFGAPYVHADIHNFELLPGNNNILFAACDGGIFKTTDAGVSWADLSSGISIGQMYNLGISARDTGITITGWQDNGSNLNNTGWDRVLGGDGFECFVDPNDRCYMYGEIYYGDFQRSDDKGATFTTITSGITETGAWNTPWLLDPNNSNIIYGGFENVWKSVDRGDNWTQLGTIPVAGSMRDLAVAPSNSNYIYAVKYNSIFKTTNGGTTWANITGTLPVASAYLTNIAISASNPDKIWVTFSGYNSGTKVYTSANGGSTWSNYSTGLPNLPVNCAIYQKGSNDGIYVGTDVGVYYRNSSMSSWQSWYQNLPNVIVDELEINYCTGKIQAATYGRALWESELYSWTGTLVTPVAEFSVGSTECPSTTSKTVCSGATASFTNLSGCADSYAWSFPGGTPSTSSAVNPVITYNTPGTYDVVLTATNSLGDHTVTKTGFVIVTAPATPANPTSNSPLCTNVTLTRTGSPPANETWYWQGTTCGTSTSQGSSSTKTVSTSGTYYIRARNNSTGCWSQACGSVIVQIDTFSASVAVPGNPTSNSPQCSSVTITRNGSPTAGYSWYWQGTTCGTSTSLGSTSTYTATVSGTYYIRARNTTTGCWSPDCGSVAVVTGTIATPANPTSNSPRCNNVTITRTGSPPSGQTWYWQGTSCDTTKLLGSGTTYSATTSGTYYLRAFASTGGCWSPACASIVVQVDSYSVSVTNPPNPTSNSPLCNAVTLTRSGSPPVGDTWYWQGTSCGTSTSLGSASTYGTANSGTYYIRARNTSTGCWSQFCGSTSVTVNTSSVAASGLIANANPICYGDSVTLTVTGGTLGTAAQWRWYYNGCGNGSAIATGNTLTGPVTSAGSVYVRAEGICNITSCVFMDLLVFPQLVVNAGTDTTLCAGQSVTLGASPTASGASPFSYNWLPATNLSSSNVANPVASPATSTTYAVTVTDANNCSKTDSVTTLVPAVNGGSGTWTWIGAIDNNWYNPCNWDRKSLPNGLSDVRIPGGTNFNPTIANSVAYCKTIVVNRQAGAVLTINYSSGGKLQLTP